MKRNATQPLDAPLPSDNPPRTDVQVSAAPSVSGLEKWLLGRLLQVTGHPPVNIVLWDGKAVSIPQRTAAPRLIISDRGALLKLAVNPDLYFGELYSEGRIQVEGDLVTLMETVGRTQPDYTQRSLWEKVLAELYLLRRNTVSRAQDNIHRHYDIGNDFYRLWLDEQMVYTCAYFPTPETSLEDAQIAKLDHVCRKLRLQPGEEVVEAGCGWGALALHMARHYGVKVKAFNISKEQLAHARERARQEGLENRVEFIEEDYRHIEGKYDAFVSVGMLEHVGPKHFRELGEIIDRCLKPTGRGLIHSIGRNRPAPMNSWIERRIFPGTYPPSLSEMKDIFEPWRFSILDLENLRLHYAETLRHWLNRFEANVDRVDEMFDQAFVRTWRCYLAGSIAAFSIGELQLFQVVFTRYDNNDIPWTRDFLYQDHD